jgi:hypothetical protein
MIYSSFKSLDHLGFVAGFCKDIQLAQYIDDELGGPNERKVSLDNYSWRCYSMV